MCYVVCWQCAGGGGGVGGVRHAARGTIILFVRVGKFLNTPYSNYCVLRYVGVGARGRKRVVESAWEGIG